AAVFAEAPGPRQRAPVRLEAPSGRHYWTEIEAQPDPRAPDRRILYLYDVSEVHHLRRQLDERTHFQDLVGKSDAMRLVYEQITQLSQVDTTVLIRGETGAGKELVARALHFASHRKDQPFIPVNCAGLTESLIGSQLFGHKRGAFTGAISDQKGVFEAADGGAVFLDEIGDIPLSLQTSLLRVLQEREITRLGDSVPHKVDVRFIAATSRTLSDEVAKGRFREDLLFRIRVARILLPPLRKRREDIPLLVDFFLERARAATGRRVLEVSATAMSILMDYHWPGNVRELESAIEAGVIRCRGAVLLPEDLPVEILHAQPAVAAPVIIPYSRADEQRRILDALERARGNRAAAARLLGMGRATLYRKLRKHGLLER
ncbi:MAG TPA: sigma-54 dependent transcriptional regulator, partial [Candidatus Hydrogenedentes bacterium]|nr:sigma-54 dependent transcriptional regulator [Candidatus Hydrogenedentota bacterium]